MDRIADTTGFSVAGLVNSGDNYLALQYDPEAWRVIGITERAFNRLWQDDFKTVTNTKIRRAHLTSRNEFTLGLLRADEPLGYEEFHQNRLEADPTILAFSDENKNIATLPYIEIENPDAGLFTNQSVGFRYTSEEREYLRGLLVDA